MTRSGPGAIISGWRSILGGGEKWRDYFDLTTRGAAWAGLGFLGVSLFVVAVPAIMTGRVQGPTELIAGVSVYMLWILALFLAITITKVTLRTPAPILDLFVPGIHALSFLLLIGVLLSVLAGPLSLVIYGPLSYMFYRLGRAAGRLGVGPAISFAVLVLVMLVGSTMSLYMLLAPGPGPI